MLMPGDSIRDLLIFLVGGHDSPFQGSRFHHPKKVTSRIARYRVGCKHLTISDQALKIMGI